MRAPRPYEGGMKIMTPTEPYDDGTLRVTRTDLDDVFRRASELSMETPSAVEVFSEDEVLEIGRELGLSPAQVRQALYERVVPREPNLADRLCGADARPVVYTIMRVPSERLTPRLIQTLAEREGLQVVRADGPRRIMVRTRDPMSRFMRFVSGRSRVATLSAAGRVELAVRPLDAATSHVALAADYTRSRRRTLRRAVILGTGASGFAAAATGAAGIAGAMQFAPPEAAVAAGIMGGIATFGGGIAGTLLLAGRRVRRRLDATRASMQALADRLAVEMSEPGAALRPLHRISAAIRESLR